MSQVFPSANLQFGRLSPGADAFSPNPAEVSAAALSDPKPRPLGPSELLAVISDSDEFEREQARQQFIGLGYLEESIRQLRESNSVRERADAVRALELIRSPCAAPYLVAALFDDAAEVRQAATEALNQVGDPDVSLTALDLFFGAGAENRAAGLLEVEVKSEPKQQSRPEEGKHSLEFARLDEHESFSRITNSFDDSSPEVRAAAAVALNTLEPLKSAELFKRALETASPERYRNIKEAIVDADLGARAINDLTGEDRERTYNALCLLSLMAKVSLLEPLITAIEAHQNTLVRSAAIRLLTSNGHGEIAKDAVRRRLRLNRLPGFAAGY